MSFETEEPHDYVDDCDCRRCAIITRDHYKQAWQTAEMQVVACGVAVHHSDPMLTTTGAYATKWNSQQLEEVRALRIERDQLKSCEVHAKRYRWMRDQSNREKAAHCLTKKMDCDGAIDAAMNAQPFAGCMHGFTEWPKPCPQCDAESAVQTGGSHSEG
jgi:hypothetical protein